MVTQVFGLDATGGVPAAINNLVEDTAPQLGGNMDLNGFNLLALTASGPAVRDEASSSTNPVFVPDQTELGTGLGGTVNEWSLIRQGTEQLSGGAGFMQASVALNMGVNNVNNIASVIAQNAGGYILVNELSSATNPTIVPDRTELGSGLGGTGNAVSLIGVGVEQITVNATGIGFFATTPVARPTGVTVDAAGIHAALVTLGLITA